MTAEIPIDVKWTEEPITQNMEKICIEMKSGIEEKARETFTVYKLVSVRKMGGSRVNYLVQLCVGENVCVHAMILQDLNEGKLIVTGVRYPKALRDPLIPFDD